MLKCEPVYYTKTWFQWKLDYIQHWFNQDLLKNILIDMHMITVWLSVYGGRLKFSLHLFYAFW